MQIRPLIELRVGRQQEPVRIAFEPQIVDAVNSPLLVNTAAGSATITVASTLGMDDATLLLIEELGTYNAEIVYVDSISGQEITLQGLTVFPHSASVLVRVIGFDEVEISNGPTTTADDASVLTTIFLTPSNDYTTYNDTDSTGGYYFARYHNSISDAFSPFSDPCPYSGYTIYSARSIIDAALGEINKKTTEVLSDEFAFQQLDAFQTDVLREQKRWSFMQSFDSIIGQFRTGQWRLPLPADIDDTDTIKSIYNIRVGTNGRLTWIDKAKWDDFIFNLAYSTLSTDLNEGDLVINLVNSGDFNHITQTNTDGSGTVIIGANSYEYSDNDIGSGVLTLTEAVTADNTATLGDYCFQNANQGLPDYYTVFDGYVWYWPITSAQYDGVNAFMDYYTKQLRIQHDSEEIVVPDALAASYFLQWKFLKKLNNGDETAGSSAAMSQYIARREKLKKKASLNRTFKMNPRFQNFAIQEQWDSGDPRYIRDGNFPNTGF